MFTMILKMKRREEIVKFCESLEHIMMAVSWGGHESLVVPAEVVRKQAAGPNSAIDFGIDARVVRLHVGLEGADVLWSDLAGAIDFAARAQT